MQHWNLIQRAVLRLERDGLLNWMPDPLYLRIMFLTRMGKPLHLKNPKTFNEKLQWLKLYDRKPEYTRMVDKYEVKKYVADIIGPEYIIPTYGVWDCVEDIDIDQLPNQFVLKCTHDSGGVVVCRDKQTMDWDAARRKLRTSMKRNYYLTSREWPYKNVRPQILAEKYMEDANSQELMDYKFYCFNGEPQFVYISKGLENHATASISFVTLDWQFAPFRRSDYKPFAQLPPRPAGMETMIDLARQLSKGLDFLRVDLYEINGQIYFSELTFTPCAGYTPFENANDDLMIGDMLALSKKESKF